MNNMRISFLVLLLLVSYVWCAKLGSVEVKAFGGFPIHNIDSGLNYATIQAAINSHQTLDGDTISVDEGIYHERVVVNRSVSLFGAGREKTVIDGDSVGCIINVTASNVTIKGFAIRNGTYGIHLDHSDNAMILENNASFNTDGIHIRYSDNCLVDQNIAGNNTLRGIFITNSRNFTASRNRVYGAPAPLGYGLNANASSKGLIILNDVFENYYDGIGLGMDSTDCTVVGNNIHDNVVRDIWLDNLAEDNLFYHNNIVRRFGQVIALLSNRWDNGFEGNYWSVYAGVDLNQDGIGDTARVISANNVDNHPLVGRFIAFRTLISHQVNVISNSAISDYEFLKSPTNSTIRMHVSNVTATQSSGFCRISIPHALMAPPFNVTIDAANPNSWNYALRDDGFNRWIYFNYQHSMHTVLVQGVTPPDHSPPSVLLESPKNRTLRVKTVSLIFTVNEPTSWIGYSLDTHANVTVFGNTTISGLSDGPHSITVYANDTTGNMGRSNIVNFNIDTLPPNIQILSPANKTYTEGSTFLDFTVDGNTLWVGYSLDGQANVTVFGNTTISGLSDGPHSITVYARDVGGHEGVAELIHFSIDTRPQGINFGGIFPIIIIAAVIGSSLAFLVYFMKFKKESRRMRRKPLQPSSKQALLQLLSHECRVLRVHE